MMSRSLNSSSYSKSPSPSSSPSSSQSQSHSNMWLSLHVGAAPHETPLSNRSISSSRKDTSYPSDIPPLIPSEKSSNAHSTSLSGLSTIKQKQSPFSDYSKGIEDEIKIKQPTSNPSKTMSLSEMDRLRRQNQEIIKTNARLSVQLRKLETQKSELLSDKLKIETEIVSFKLENTKLKSQINEMGLKLLPKQRTISTQSNKTFFTKLMESKIISKPKTNNTINDEVLEANTFITSEQILESSNISKFKSLLDKENEKSSFKSALKDISTNRKLLGENEEDKENASMDIGSDNGIRNEQIPNEDTIINKKSYNEMPIKSHIPTNVFVLRSDNQSSYSSTSENQTKSKDSVNKNKKDQKKSKSESRIPITSSPLSVPFTNKHYLDRSGRQHQLIVNYPTQGSKSSRIRSYSEDSMKSSRQSRIIVVAEGNSSSIRRTGFLQPPSEKTV